MKNNRLKNRKKGLAIELAVLVLFVVVALSTLLVSVSILNKNTLDSLSNSVNERLYLDQIGQSFVSAVKNNSVSDWESNFTDQKYTAHQTNGTELVLKEEGQVKLSIKLESDNNNGYKITEWKYS